MWHSLIANFAVVGLFISAWLQAQEFLQKTKRLNRRLLFGALMGCGAVVSMLLSAELRPGVFFDLRSTFIALSAFLGGPFAALLTGFMVGLYRLGAGGVGVAGGLVGILLAMAVGLIAHTIVGRKTPSWTQLVAFAFAASATPMLGLAALPTAIRDEAIQGAALPMLALGFAATFIAASSIAQTRSRVEERKLLLGALKQAPDYLFVKDRSGRFVAVNEAVATVNGIASSDKMRGLTDFDIAPRDRAQRLFDEEQRVMATETSILEVEELIKDDERGPRWYSTSKAAVHNVDGEVIGLAGVTRDVTDRKRLEKALAETSDQLNLVLAGMSDGLALFDADARIAFCNEQYRSMFPLTAELRVPGAMLADILHAAVARGEQLDIPPDGVSRWVATVLKSLKTGGETEVRLYDGRWLHIRTKPFQAGGAIVIVSDITEIKKAETGLRTLTQQLQVLARTDGLTGLLNRRSLDEHIKNEVARAHRSKAPLALLMVDIDRFKAFNDRYGHLAGDECIRQVANVLLHGAKRSADIVARYGGEEMCLILPDTDETGAFELAERLRIKVRDLGLEHDSSEKGLVTISIGVSAYSGDEVTKSAIELVGRADEALYIAKGAGRDRVMGWSERLSSRAKTA